ncbi:MAG: 23S rRNA pseudouridine(955/2504/2580) synthase RluC [Enterobacterales bacterium]
MLNNNFYSRYIKVQKNKHGQRIDNFLFTYIKYVPKSLIYKIIRKGKILVNKKKITPRYKLKYKDIISLPLIDNLNVKNKNCTIIKKNIFNILNNIIIYEDDYLLAINKPHNIAVHGGSGLKFGIIEALRASRPKYVFLELIHRLDKETSGVLLIAKKMITLRKLHEQFRKFNEIKKNYLVLVKGKWPINLNKISLYLKKNINKNGNRLMQVNKLGIISKTNFYVKEKFTIATLIVAKPITGKTHQIRVHTQFYNHPIALDNKYGNNIFNKKITKLCSLNRLFLHASSIKFKHPKTNNTINIQAPISEDLEKCLLYLRKYCLLN